MDIHTLATHGIDVPTGLAAAKAIDQSFETTTSVRALQFYGDGTLSRVPAAMQKDLTRWAQTVDLSNLPLLHPRRGLSPACPRSCQPPDGCRKPGLIALDRIRRAWCHDSVWFHH